MKRKLMKIVIMTILFTFLSEISPFLVFFKNRDIATYCENELLSFSKFKEEVKMKAEILVGLNNEYPMYNAQSVQYALMQGDDMILSDNAGSYSNTDDRELTKDIMYGLGSVSKMYVTTAVMQLVDEEKLDLDIPVVNYIDDFTMEDKRYKEITPRMLLNHSSGLMGSTGINAILLDDNDTCLHDSFLENLKSQKLKADPGEFSVYCNDGFTLAEILVERLSGMSFSEYIKERISKPLTLNHLKTPLDEFDHNLLAKTYSFSGSHLRDDPVENVMFIGAGGLYASAEDSALFTRAITRKDGRGILSNKSIDAMAENESSKGVWVDAGEDNSTSYGLGWDSVNLFPFNRYNIKAYCKGGDTIAYHSCIISIPSLDITMAVNSSGGNSSIDTAFASQVILMYLQFQNIIDNFKEDIKLTSEKSEYMPKYLKQYEGRYNIGNRVVRVSIFDNGTLELKDPFYEVPIIFHYTYSNYFIMDGNSVGIRFVDEENGITYLEEKFYIDYKGFSQGASDFYLGEKVSEEFLSKKEEEVWQNRNSKLFFVLNEKYSSYVYSSAQSPFNSFYFKDGYVAGSKIISECEANPVIKIPGNAGRDLTYYKFFKVDGIEYADCGFSKFISIDGVSYIDKNIKTIKIDENGYAKWFVVPRNMSGKTMKVECPDKSSFNYYKGNGICINNSYITGVKEIKLEAFNFISFVGEKEKEFNIIIS